MQRAGRSWRWRAAGALVVLAGLMAGCSTPSTAVHAVEANSVQAPDTSVEPASDPLPFDSTALVDTLPNGLTTIVRSNDRPGGEVQLRLVVDAGSVLEDPDQAGVAHFLEHMMFNGTEKYPKNQLTAALQHFGAAFGADVNAYTSYDETVYELTVPNDPAAVSVAVDILHEWLTAATLDDADVTAERGVVLDEWRQSSESADGRTFATFDDALLAGSPYADRDPIGSDAAIEAMTPAPLRRFYDRWYRPDNATVIVVGDIDADATQRQLAGVFGDAAPRAAGSLDRPVAGWQPPSAAQVVVHRDPDLSSATAEVAFVEPDDRAAERRPQTGDDARRQVFDDLIVTLIANRLDDAIRRGDVQISSVDVDTSAPVRAIELDGVVVTARPGKTTDAVRELVDEVQRAASFGFDDAEVARAVGAARSALDDERTAASTVNDVQVADEFVEYVLNGAPASDPGVAYAAGTAALDGATAAALSAELADTWDSAHPFVLVAAPDAADGVPDVDDVRQILDDAEGAVEVPTTDPGGPAATALMDRPEPVQEQSTSTLPGDGDIIAPKVLHFANGLDVVLDHSGISDGEITVGAVRDGGLSVVDDAHVPAAWMAPGVVSASGLGDLDAVDVSHVLSATGIDLSPAMSGEMVSIDGTTSADDLETTMAYVHQLLAAPHADDAALSAQIDSVREAIDGAPTDPDAAQYLALNRARYGDTPRYRGLLTDAELDTVTADDVLAQWQARFGGANGWRIVLVGDVDVQEATQLARAYFGSLEAGPPAAHFVDRQGPFPDGATRVEVRAGTGDKASLVRTAEADADAADLGRAEALSDVLTTVLDTRLTDTVREALGASYSPTAYVYVVPMPRPTVNVELDVTGAPDDMPRLHEVIDEQLADLVANGPTAREWADATAAVGHEYGYVDDPSIAWALAQLPLRAGALDDYLDRSDTLDELDRGDARQLAADLFGAGRYIEVVTLPA